MPGLPLKDGLPKLLVKLRVLFARFQDPGVLSQNLLAAIPGDAGEGRVDILDVTVGIGNHHGFRRLLDGGYQPDMLRLRLLTFREVFVSSQNPHHFAFLVMQRQFAGAEPNHASIRPVLCFLVAEPGCVLFHHQLVIGAVCFRRFPPGKLIVVLSHDLRRVFQPRIHREGSVTA